MEKITKKIIKEFLNENFPDIDFDGIEIIENNSHHCHFKVISFGIMIGQSDELIDENYWEKVKKHLDWMWK